MKQFRIFVVGEQFSPAEVFGGVPLAPYTRHHLGMGHSYSMKQIRTLKRSKEGFIRNVC
jgi:hypothetical protein